MDIRYILIMMLACATAQQGSTRTSEGFVESCKQQTNTLLNVTDYEFSILDQKRQYTDTNLCGHDYIAVIDNEFTNCLALQLANEHGIKIFWAEIRFPDNKDGTTCSNLNGSLFGSVIKINRENVSNCIVPKLIEEGNPKRQWINYECSANVSVLCSNKYFKRNESTSNNNLPSDCFYSNNQPTAECQTSFEEVCNENNDLAAIDTAILSNANAELDACKGENKCGNILIRRFKNVIDECTESTLNQFSLGCPHLSEEFHNQDVKFAVMELFDINIKKNIREGNTPLAGNNRNVKLFSESGRLLSINVIGERNQTIQPAHVTFYYKFDFNETLLKNSRSLTFENEDNSYFATSYRVKNINLECSFYNITTGFFESGGCECIEEETRAKCISTHTTIFAVLLSVNSESIPAEVKIISTVLQTISVAFLLITFSVLVRVRKKVRGERIAVQINLVVSLVLLNITTLLQYIAMHIPTFCRAVAVLTHFFLLSTALWMTNEALLLFLKTSRWAVVQTNRRKVVIGSMLFGWGLATVICTMTAIVGFATGTYMKNSYLSSVENVTITDILRYDYCWLSGSSNIRLAAIIPVAVSILVNIAIAIKVGVFVYRKTSETRNFKPTVQDHNKHKLDVDQLQFFKASLKAVFLLLPILGIPWVLMFTANISDDTARISFMYANVVLNGAQGVFVFVVYCIVSIDVREAAMKSLSPINSAWLVLSESIEKRRKKSGHPTNDYSSGKNSVHLPGPST